MISHAKYFEYLPRWIGQEARKELGASVDFTIKQCTCIGAATHGGDLCVITDGDANAHALLEVDELPDAEIARMVNGFGETMYEKLDSTMAVYPEVTFADFDSVYSLAPTEPLCLMFSEVFFYTEDDDGVLQACSRMYHYRDLRKFWARVMTLAQRQQWREVLKACPDLRAEYGFNEVHNATFVDGNEEPVWTTGEASGVEVTTPEGIVYYELDAGRRWS